MALNINKCRFGAFTEVFLGGQSQNGRKTLLITLMAIDWPHLLSFITLVLIFFYSMNRCHSCSQHLHILSNFSKRTSSGLSWYLLRTKAGFGSQQAHSGCLLCTLLTASCWWHWLFSAGLHLCLFFLPVCTWIHCCCWAAVQRCKRSCLLPHGSMVQFEYKGCLWEEAKSPNLCKTHDCRDHSDSILTSTVRLIRLWLFERYRAKAAPPVFHITVKVCVASTVCVCVCVCVCVWTPSAPLHLTSFSCFYSHFSFMW